MNAIQTWYRTLPRSGRWLTWAAVFVLGYFAIVEPMLGVASSINLQAERYAAIIRRNNLGADEKRLQDATLTAGLRSFGKVNDPGDAKAGGEALTKRLNAILTTNGIKYVKIRDRVLSLPNNGPLSQTLGPGEGIDRLIKDVEFEASPDKLLTILSALEQSPDVVAVSRVQLTKATGSGSRGSTPPKVLNVNLSIETWVRSRKSGRTS